MRNYIKELAELLAGQKFDWYVAISRGGLVPACLLAQETGQWKIDTFCARSYDGDQQKSLEVAPKNSVHLIGKDILIVDDLTDSGRTLHVAATAINAVAVKSIKTATIFKKTCSAFEPDFYVEETPKDEWIVFPWEEPGAIQIART